MNTDSERKRPLWRRVGRWVVRVAVATFVAVLLIRMVWGYVEARNLHNEVARIRAAKEPLTLNELAARRPKIAPADDAGPYYEAALALLRAGDASTIADTYDAVSKAMKASPASRPADEAVAAAERLLAVHALVLEMLDRAAERPACGRAVDADGGMARCLEHLGRARNAARLVALRALLKANRDGDAAIDSLVCLLRMLRMFESQPLVVAHLVRVACTSRACDDARIVLETGRPSDAALQRLHEVLLAVEPGNTLESVMLAERAYGIELMGEVISRQTPSGLPGGPAVILPGQWPVQGFWMRPWGERLATGYLRDMAGLIQKSRLPLHDALAAIEESTGATSLLGRLAAPPMLRMGLLTARATAEARCTAIAAMVERYRRQHGRPPAALDALTPEYAATLPVDPFTGKPLLYRADGEGYTVYSVGEDRKDDGGDTTAADGRKSRDDGIRIRITSRG